LKNGITEESLQAPNRRNLVKSEIQKGPLSIKDCVRKHHFIMIFMIGYIHRNIRVMSVRCGGEGVNSARTTTKAGRTKIIVFDNK
jgi:hypothetical protein